MHTLLIGTVNASDTHKWMVPAIVNCSSMHPSEAAGLLSGSVTGHWNMLTTHQLREEVLKEVRLLLSRGRLVMSKDIFFVVVVEVTEFSWYLESRDQRCFQTSCNDRTGLTAENYLVQNVKSAEAEKLWCGGIVRLMCQESIYAG